MRRRRQARRTLGHEDQVGTIRVGRKADLVIVNGNPVENLKLLFGTRHAPAERRDRRRSSASVASPTP